MRIVQLTSNLVLCSFSEAESDCTKALNLDKRVSVFILFEVGLEEQMQFDGSRMVAPIYVFIVDLNVPAVVQVTLLMMK